MNEIQTHSIKYFDLIKYITLPLYNIKSGENQNNQRLKVAPF